MKRLQVYEQVMWRKKAGRLIRVFTPFTLLLAGFLLVNYKIEDVFVFQQSSTPTTPEKIETPAGQTAATPPPTNGGPPPIATAIAHATEMPTITPVATSQLIPTLLPNDSVQLSGPPVESRFSLSTPITFYWFANRLLSEGESFKLFLANDTVEKLVGTVSEPNIGEAYQVNFIPESAGLSAGEFFWTVKIVKDNGGLILGESDWRSITLLEVEN